MKELLIIGLIDVFVIILCVWEDRRQRKHIGNNDISGYG